MKEIANSAASRKQNPAHSQRLRMLGSLISDWFFVLELRFLGIWV